MSQSALLRHDFPADELQATRKSLGILGPGSDIVKVKKEVEGGAAVPMAMDMEVDGAVVKVKQEPGAAAADDGNDMDIDEADEKRLL